MAKTLRGSLLSTLLMAIFLISSFQSRGAALTNFSWSSTSNYPAATVTYTFSFQVPTAAPAMILYAYTSSSAVPFNCAGVIASNIIVKVNGVQQAVNTTTGGTGSSGTSNSLIVKLVNPALATANSNIVITVPGVVSTYLNGSYAWSWIQTANSTGNPIDVAASPSNIIVETFAPTTQATNVIFSSVQATQMTASWSNGNGEKRAVFMKQASSGTAAPVNGTDYGANTVFGTGTSYYQIGSTGWYCIYNGTGTSVTVTNLTASTAYQVHVCEYNGPTYTQAYNTTSPTGNPNLLTSTPLAPIGTAAQIFCSGATVTSLAATGTAIQWYATASGGTALAASVALANATHYYASQTIGGIESGGRLDVTATVNSAPAAPTLVSATPALVCAGASSVLNATSTGYYINWYTVNSGGTALSYSASAVNYTVTPGSTTTYYAETVPAYVLTNQTIAYTGAIVSFTVPAGVTTLTIDAKGAQGGSGKTYTGGLGARMKGDFSVTPGQILKVLVGQQGGTHATNSSGGGGGGTFVTTSANAALVIAGGGSGGGGNTNPSNGNPGLITQSGGNSASSTGGTPGNGGGATTGSAGGGGLTGNGSTTTCSGLSAGSSFTNGGAGGSAVATGGAGGFGGGSSGEWVCAGSTGAGGGYSGGAGCIGSGVAGAGGSINNGTNQTNTSGNQTGNGQVIFSWMAISGCPSSTRTPVTLTVNATTVPTGAATQTYCTGATVANLTATGTAILWYSVLSGGTALATSAPLISGTHYYASQTVGGFESCTRLDVLVTVYAILDAPTSVTATPVNICTGSSSALSGLSTGNTINWYTVASGGSALGSTISGANYSVSPGTSTTYYAETIPTATNGTQQIDYTGSIVNFTVPSGVTTLTIDAKGAQGGSGLTYAGGLGARMKGDIAVTQGQVLKILVGQQGGISGSYKAGGGGGGTFVTTSLNEAIVIAGGGSGGGGNSSPSNGSPGLITEAGGNATGAIGGVGGLGGGAALGSAGGGGLTGNGGATSCASLTAGLSFTNGGTGGTTVNGGKGGFGGGSGGEYSCQGSTGAGGGYSGGAGCNNGGVAGAGGSKNTGANQTNTSGYQSGNGQVILSWSIPGSGCPSVTRTPVTVTVNPTVATPTGTAAQTFCAGATVMNLSATGTGILWYAASTGGIALATTTVLVNGTHYYASQTDPTSGCESTGRLDITATVNTTATPTGSGINLCSGATVANLKATGTGIKWYAASTGGAALASSVVLVNATHYYATQTLNGCESPGRFDQSPTVYEATAPPTSSAAQNFCSGATVANLSATGTNMAWYIAPTGGSSMGSYIPLINGTHYYVSQTNMTTGCASSRFDVTATVYSTAAPTGTAAQTFCSGSTVANLSATGTNIAWYTASTGGTSLATSVLLVNGTHYYASQTLNGCVSISRLDVAATVNSTTTPTGAASQTFYSAATVANLMATGTGIVWYAASTGGSALASSVVLTTGAHYYASQTDASTSCESAGRFNVTASVYMTPAITSFTPLTANTGATVTLTGSDFIDATAVSFGSTAATSFRVVDTHTITAVVAGGSTGTISVTAPGGTSASSGTFTFIQTPVITSFIPTVAATGATVTITGTDLTGATAVSFGGTAAASFSVVNNTTITAVVAGGTTGIVSVTTPGGTASSGVTLIFSQTQTWTGSTSPDWNMAGNWSTNGVPLLNDNIIIPNVTSKPVVSDLTIGIGGTVTIEPGAALTVSGTLTNNCITGTDGLVIQSDGTGSGSLINETLGVSATVARWMTGDIWHLVSPSATAISTPTVADFAGSVTNQIAYYGTSYGLAPYKESDDTWSYYGYPTPLGSFDTPGKGYEILRGTTDADGTGTHTGNDGTVSFKGALAAGNLTTSISKSGNGWNLVGNPYPCGLDINKFLTDAGNSSAINSSYLAIYVRDISPAGIISGGYSAINNSGTLLLSSGEGFLVKASSAGFLNFTTAMKSITSDAFKSAEVPYPGITLSAQSGAQTLSTVVKYIPGMTSGLDPGWDAGLFNGSASAFSLYTRLVKDNGVDFCIQALPDNDYENLVIPVGLIASKGSTVTFKAAVANLPSTMKVYLEDKITGTTSRLDDGSDYSVKVSSDLQGAGRFYLRTTSVVSAVPGDLAIDLKIIPLPLNEIIRLLGNVTLPAVAFVYDMTGRLITQKVLAGSYENDIPLVNVTNGVYLLKIESSKGLITKKVAWIKF